MRIAFTVVLVLMLGVFGFLALRISSWLRRGDAVVDERDRAIMAGSQGLRSAAMLVTLALWLIGLQEGFHSQGAVPVFYLYLVFWSVLVVSLLSFPVGILFGYRSS